MVPAAVGITQVGVAAVAVVPAEHGSAQHDTASQ
jgi:uncharacterized cupin superfamily protein